MAEGIVARPVLRGDYVAGNAGRRNCPYDAAMTNLHTHPAHRPAGVVVLRRDGAPALIFVGPATPEPAAAPRAGQGAHPRHAGATAARHATTAGRSPTPHRGAAVAVPPERVRLEGLGAARFIDVVTGEHLDPGTDEITLGPAPRLLIAEAWAPPDGSAPRQR